MIQYFPAKERGHIHHGWLDAACTFSFGQYFVPGRTGFRAIRAINEQTIRPRAGFGEHPHAHVEILTYVLEGELAHEDGVGNREVLVAHEIQLLSAGTGLMCTEYNPSWTVPAHIVQVWIRPNAEHLAPTYTRRALPKDAGGGLHLLVAPYRHNGACVIHQDLTVYAGILSADDQVRRTLAEDRYAWVQALNGEMIVGTLELQRGDGVAISGEEQVEITARGPAEVLLLDLA